MPRGFAVLLIILWAVTSQAQAQETKDWLPPELAPWSGWVLQGREGALCPPLSEDATRRQCQYPTRLRVAADADGATFQQVWRVFAPQTVLLPSALGVWPAAVTVGGKPAPVLDVSGRPGVRLTTGEWTVEGRLAYSRRPETLLVAPQTGLVELVLDGKAVDSPRLTPDGTLDITGMRRDAAAAEGLRVTVMRLLRDGQPFSLVTRARLEVSGRGRTISLDGLLPPQSEPLGVSSPVPLGFGPGGQVLVQAGAGTYDVEITSRLPADTTAIGPGSGKFGREVWAFQGDQALRELKIEGAAQIDPQNTDLPQAWRHFPAYVLDGGKQLALRLVRRGEAPAASEEMNVTRTFWLDFDGKGLTAQDTISGQMPRQPILSMTSPAELGRATANGRDLPIVMLPGSGKPGVELRQSPVSLTAESRYADAGAAFPASGWDAGVTSLSAVLNLPPGWSLFTASGPDSVSRTWLGRWNMLDIFIVVLAAVAAWKLGGLPSGFALLGFLVLSRHEANAPVDLWIALLAALGLAKAFQASARAAQWPRLGWLIAALRTVALLWLAVGSLLFAAGQLRIGLYPQLNTPSQQPPPVTASQTAAKPAARAQAENSKVPPPPMPAQSPRMLEAAPAPGALSDALPPPGPDPTSLTQTGPGVPTWRWRSIKLTWNGPVTPDQTLRLVLLPPGANTAMCFARVGLLLAAFWLLGGGALRRLVAVGGKTAVLLLACGALLGGSAQAATTPTKEMLEELRTRLLAPAECFPNCAGLTAMDVALDAKSLTLSLDMGAAARLAAPLPVVSGWRASSVTVDGKPAPLFADETGLRVLLEPGAHRVVVSGAVPADASVTVSTPLPARNCTVRAPGWSVLGLGQDGAFQGSLRLTRLETAKGGAPASLTPVIPAFLEVRRTMQLGLTWQARTTVRRLTPADQPVLVQVPLLPGESVLAGSVPVENGKAVVSLAAGQQEAAWDSSLAQAATIDLQAPDNAPWVEAWRLAPSSVWDVALSGIPVTASLDEKGAWSPLWRPWPGDKVHIAVTRPQGAPGNALTIDFARLKVAVGERQDETRMTLRLRSALGGRHVLRLPQEAHILEVRSGRGAVPWSSEKPGEVGLTLTPGAQEVTVVWRQPREGLWRVAGPMPDLGAQAANIEMSVDLPKDRVVLWASGDTRMGPAVLLWGALGGVAALALLLSRLPWTPLTFLQWLLLGLGLAKPGGFVAMCAVAWLPALGLRKAYPARAGWFLFNLVQLVLVGLVFVGLGGMFDAVREGLLGTALGAVAGNGSSPSHLIWTFDRVAGSVPEVRVWSAPVWCYRGAMLAWALWLALSLLGWLRWGWGCFTEGGVWRKPVWRLGWPFRRGGQEKNTGGE